MGEMRSSEECEVGLIGSILLDADRVMLLCLTAGLTHDAFTSGDRQLIYRACCYLHKNSKAINSVLVANELKKYKQLDNVGGVAGINSHIDNTPTAAHAEFYLEGVEESWLSRKIETADKSFLDEVRTATESPKVLLASQIQRLTGLVTQRTTSSKVDAWERVKEGCMNAKKGILPGLKSPWQFFNAAMGGAPYGMVTVIGGRGGTRKSYLANQWAVYAGVESDEQIPGAYFPLEDGPEVALRRAACMLANVNAWHYRRGKVDKDEMDAVGAQAARIKKSPLELCGGRGMSVDDIALEVARGVSKYGWKFVLIDAFKDLRGGGSDFGAGEVYKSGRLCDMAAKHGVATLVVHHIRKTQGEDDGFSSKEDQRISLDDIKGRKEITDDARMVLLLQCQKYTDNEGNPRLKKFVLECQKSNHGPLGRAKFNLDPDIGRFIEVRKGERHD